MSNLKKHNDIDQLYEEDVYYSELKEKYICPVCGKGFQSEKGAKNHKDRRNCFNAVSLFKNTLTENKMFRIYKTFLDKGTYVSRYENVSIKNFRKEPVYKPLAKFVHFCYKNKISSMEEYFYFIYYSNKTYSVKNTLEKGITNKWLRKFRKWLKENPELIDSDRFIEANYNKLKKDANFLIRSLQRSDVSLFRLMDYIDIEEVPMHKQQLKDLKEVINEFKESSK